MNWIKIEDIKSVPQVTPVLIYGKCCDICYNVVVGELEVDQWFVSGTGEDLTFIPSHYCLIDIPSNEETIK